MAAGPWRCAGSGRLTAHKLLALSSHVRSGQARSHHRRQTSGAIFSARPSCDAPAFNLKSIGLSLVAYVVARRQSSPQSWRPWRAPSVSPLPPPVVNRRSASRVPRMRPPPGLLGFQVLFPSRLPQCETVVRRILLLLLLLLLLPFENARPALGAGHRTAPHRTAHVEILPSAPCEPHRHEFCQGRAGERRHDEMGQQVTHCSRER